MCSDDNNAFYENPYIKIPLMVTGIWWIRNWFKGTQYRDPDRIDGKIAVVTGSSSGIGKCIAEELNRRGAKVYMLCRNREKSEKVIDELVQKGCDEERLILRIANLCDFNSLKSFSEKFRQDERKLDILVNNASVIALPKFNKTIDGYEETWQANFVGHVVLTELLLPQLKASESARIIMTGSRLHFFGDTISPEVANDPKHYGRLLPYNRAKLALTMYVRGLAQRLQEDGVNNVTVNIFHPGMVNTPLYRTTPFKMPIISHILSPGAALIFKTPMDGAQTGIFLACSPKVEGISGKYFDECQETRPASQVLDDQKVRQIFGYTRNVLKSLGIE